jgi:peptide-methionine (S)-S-oxide reductase
MFRHRAFRLLPFLGAILLTGLAACQPTAVAGELARLPPPAVDAAHSTAHNEVAVFAGGCFWGIEAVFERIKGVQRVTAGYSGGHADTAHYEEVGNGDTGHAESVKVEFDPSRVSYGQLLQVFFSVALNPTELNRQGPDSGTQYRSVVFYANDEQRKIATGYIAQLTSIKAFGAPIVTQVVPLKAFYPAEAYHQHYYDLHPNNPYIVFNDAPKVAHLQQLFPELYQAPRHLVEVQLH